ncbi:MAG TPA: sialidase family protein [Thermoanaerobaculia bacterium]|nr:sialidase family protein [Thermoanaerobaculia bacterium]
MRRTRRAAVALAVALGAGNILAIAYVSAAPNGVSVAAADRALPSSANDVPLIEPHLAAHPTDPRRLVGAAIVITKPDFSETDCATFSSSDGGATWTRRDLGLKQCADPWVAILPDGTPVLAVLEGEGSLLVYRSADGGATWTKTADLGAGHDHETLTVDSKSGALYLLSVQGATEPASGRRLDSVFAARSDDGGRTFAPPARLFPNNLSTNTMTGAVLADGSLAISFTSYARPSEREAQVWLDPITSWLTRSYDGGRTLAAPDWVSSSCGRSFPQLVADPSPGASRDRLYWLCNGRASGVSPTPDFERIMLSSSADRGARWSDPVSVAGGGGRANVRNAVAAVNKDGVVGVSWYDGRNEKNRSKQMFSCLDVYFAASFDGGRTFAPETRVSAESSCGDAPANGNAKFRWPAGGDYHGLAARADGAFQILWADSRDGRYRLHTATVDAAGAAEIPPTAPLTKEKK